MKFNNIEKEVIFLKATKRLIDDMVNNEVVKLLGNNTDLTISFNSRTHMKYFNIILLDFLSCSDEKILGEKLSYLGALQSICKSPNFNINNSINSLTQSTKEFIDWLEKEILVKKIWLPSIKIEADLSIKRIEFIKMCGNISKHNFSRLSGVVRELIEIFKRNKITLKDENALLILDEFYELFHTDIFNYHSSAIAEFLNNIRWGIYDYLQPKFQQSIVYESTGYDHRRIYHYTYPKKVKNNFAKNCYCDLMNKIRSKPYMNRFQVTRYLKMRY
ncbi:MAG: hypothetical protein AABY84_08935 [Candidatus Firestonebacteria bacterium]